LFPHSHPELAEDFLMGYALATGERGAGPVQRLGSFWREIFLFDGSYGQGSGERLNQDLEKVAHSVKLLLRQRIKEGVSLLTLFYRIRFHVHPLRGWTGFL
jgi:hypothetical protein